MLRYFLLILACLLFTNLCDKSASMADDTSGKLTENKIPSSNKVLALSRTNLSGSTANVGDQFSAKVVEDLIIEENIIIPSGSTVTGKVTESRPPKRFALNKNGRIKISIDQIQTPDGRDISLLGNNVEGIIISPYSKTLKRRIGEGIAPLLTTNGTSIPLGQATNLNGGVIYAISSGVRVVTGFFTGIIAPDPGKTRMQSAFRESLLYTPVGTAYQFTRKGYPAEIQAGDSIILNFDRKTIAKIQNQYFAKALAE